jgi:hypothetical protein
MAHVSRTHKVSFENEIGRPVNILIQEVGIERGIHHDMYIEISGWPDTHSMFISPLEAERLRDALIEALKPSYLHMLPSVGAE